MAATPNHAWASGSRQNRDSPIQFRSHATSSYSNHLHPPTLGLPEELRESPTACQLPGIAITTSRPASGVNWVPQLCQSVPRVELEQYNTSALPLAGHSAHNYVSLPQDGLDFPANIHQTTVSPSTLLAADKWQDFLTGTRGSDASHQLSPPRRIARSHACPRTTSASSQFSQPQATRTSTSPLAGHDNNYTLGIPRPSPPQMSPYMAQETMTETMQTPVSPVSAHNSPHDTAMGEPPHQLPRKRSHSVMSQQHDNIIADVLRSRAPSIHSQTGASPTEEFSPRGSRAFKRGDPPTNPEGKYICNYAEECFGQVFDRKCEWSKHMDKHDRPYRCPHPSCAKLQGFTYSGGLLRHEREVHGKHGGPKAQLVCPFTDCKRHSGKGFTRKENLNEHLRRVHNGKDASSQHDMILERNDNDVGAVTFDGTETQVDHMSSTIGDELTSLEPSLKRKRSDQPQDHTGLTALDENNVMQELQHLRAENAWQADRIRQLEAAAAMNAEKTQRLEETISLWAQQNSQAHIPHDQQQQQQQQQPEQPLMQQHENEQQHFLPQHEDQNTNEHHQLPEQHIVEQHLGDQQPLSHDTVEGDMKAVFAAVQEG